MLTQQQIENIQIDYGMVYVNFGEVGERLLGPTRGGGEFTVSKNVRDIEFDGSRGKSKGMQVVDEVNAMLTAANLDTSMDELALAMPYATYSGGVISCKSSNVGVIPNSAYLSNVTMFAKVVGGGYKKIVLYNAMSESDFTLNAAPKAEGSVSLEIYAHWDPLDDTKDLYDVQDTPTLGADTTKPTVSTVPVDADTGIGVSTNLTAEFSEDIKQGDIDSNYFILIKASDGSIIAGDLSYIAGTKTATFNPTSDLEAATDYIWMISNVKDLAGNKMDPVVVNFTTA